MRLRNKNWTYELIENDEKVIKNPQDYKGNWKEFFGNDNPIHIEIGIGKGNFILENAKRNRDINYIGIEKYTTILGISVKKQREYDLHNIGFIRADANTILDIFSDDEISRVYLNFSDPWPKLKQEKRRLTYKDFLNKYKYILCIGGEVHFKTDNTKLFEFSLNSFCENDWKLKNISLDLHNSDFEGNIMTEYEEKFSKKNNPIYRLEAKSPKC